MEYLPISDESIKKAAQVMRSGGIVAFPTETVYGLGADAFNPDALVKVFEAKARPRFDPLIIHIANTDTLNEVANLSLLTESAKKKLFLLTKAFWPGPLSIVLPKSDKIPGIATAGLSTAAVRFPANEIAQKLITLAGGAIAAPSANPFGALSPTKAQHVKDGLGEKVDIILDGGSCAVGVESTVIDITGEKACILRHGGVTKEEIEKVINEQISISSEQLAISNEQSPASPGLLKSHYAPRTPLIVFDLNAEDAKIAEEEKDAAWLFFDSVSRDNFLKSHHDLLTATCYLLSTEDSTHEAAACLFETLHEMDKLGAKRIYAQLAPNEGLGAAINDRLRRASTPLKVPL